MDARRREENEKCHRGRAETAGGKIKNTTIETFTGRLIDVTCITKDDIDWRDVAHSLSLQCRFSGHCKYFYSVAAHSIHCYYEARRLHLSRRLCTSVLLHDGGEAYWHDLALPHKLAPGIGAYVNYLHKAQDAVYDAAHLLEYSTEYLDVIKMIDIAVLKAEARRLMIYKDEWRWMEHMKNIKPARIPAFRWWWYLFSKNAERRFLQLVKQWEDYYAGKLQVR